MWVVVAHLLALLTCSCEQWPMSRMSLEPIATINNLGSIAWAQTAGARDQLLNIADVEMLFIKNFCKLKQRSVIDHPHHVRAGGHIADNPNTFPRLLQATVFVELPLPRTRRTHLGMATCEVPTEMRCCVLYKLFV